MFDFDLHVVFIFDFVGDTRERMKERALPLLERGRNGGGARRLDGEGCG